MTPEEKKAALDATAEERAGSLQPAAKPLTVSSLHERVAALETGPRLGSPVDHSEEIANLRERIQLLEAAVGKPEEENG